MVLALAAALESPPPRLAVRGIRRPIAAAARFGAPRVLHSPVGVGPLGLLLAQ